ncbi:unnamed protein product [Ectocarpus sp. 12 AP-2014]
MRRGAADKQMPHGRRPYEKADTAEIVSRVSRNLVFSNITFQFVAMVNISPYNQKYHEAKGKVQRQHTRQTRQGPFITAVPPPRPNNKSTENLKASLPMSRTLNSSQLAVHARE